jgi:Zn finger protein HypA/HybF involved in hydrogenase expression
MSIQIATIGKCLDCETKWKDDSLYELTKKCPKCGSEKLDFMHIECAMLDTD